MIGPARFPLPRRGRAGKAGEDKNLGRPAADVKAGQYTALWGLPFLQLMPCAAWFRLGRLFVYVWVLLGLAAPAQARLGGPLADVAKEGTPLPQTLRQTLRAIAAGASAPAGGAVGVQTETVQTDTGVIVTEYANAAGTVFALTWRGPVMPDLQQFFGDYFAQFRAAPPAAAPSLNARSVHAPDLRVRIGGHMRAFFGVAWVPSLVPAGFDPARLQP